MAADSSLSPQVEHEVLAVEAGRGVRTVTDNLAVEEALEIRVSGADPVITMRTPGHDLDLAAGLLVSEGVIAQRRDLAALRHWMGNPHIVQAMTRSMAAAAAGQLQRSSLSNSACGVCGKAKLNLEPLRRLPPLPEGPRIDIDTLLALPQRLRHAQGVFERTGGLHAAALFDADGQLCAIREDVGRHNAVDKLVGWALRNDRLPLHDHILMLSGRASFELIQKALMASIPMVCAVSAPSSYAARLAREFDLTLVGFLRHRRFNVYAARERIRGLGTRRAAAAFPNVQGDCHESRRVS